MLRFLDVLAVFRSRRIAVIFALGFSSGLPLLLTGQTLTAWMTTEGVSLTTIGAFSLVGLPYTFKWAWAPLLDRYRLPWLGRRRGWLALTQLLLLFAIAAMGSVDPVATPGALALLAVTVAFLSASQDVVVDAYSTDVLPPEQRAAGSAMNVMGYRVAMLVTGTLALILADHLPWRTIYWLLAALQGCGLMATYFAEEPAHGSPPPSSLAVAIGKPFGLLLRQPGVVVVLLFVALYRFGDYQAQALVISFLKQGMGFTLTEVATINKVCGLIGTLLGGVVAGVVVGRLGVRRMLLVFGLLQATTNFGYVVLALGGKSLIVFGGAVFVDYLANAMGTAAFVAYLMSLCDRSVSATQYALLTSLSSVGLRVFGFTTGYLQGSVGWPGFFACTAGMALPGLALALWLPREPSTPVAPRAVVRAA